MGVMPRGVRAGSGDEKMGVDGKDQKMVVDLYLPVRLTIDDRWVKVLPNRDYLVPIWPSCQRGIPP